MKLDLEKGMSLKIEGEIGKFQTIPIDKLIDISKNLQDLILTIAKIDLNAESMINVNNFKIELAGFEKSSAVPIFVFTSRVEPTFDDYKLQRNEVSEKLDKILAISNQGNYHSIKELYPDNYRRNEIVESLYSFTNSFDNSPVSIGNFSTTTGFESLYSIKKFNAAVKKDLIVTISETFKSEKSEESAYAYVKIVKKGKNSRNQIQEIISKERHSLSYSPEIINVRNKQYILKYPLRCLFEKEDDYYIINNEVLDIIGTGETTDEAENNFNEEFDFLFHRLNSLPNSKLSTRLQEIKGQINMYVKEIN